jgi:hypothetical protein
VVKIGITKAAELQNGILGSDFLRKLAFSHPPRFALASVKKPKRFSIDAQAHAGTFYEIASKNLPVVFR